MDLPLHTIEHAALNIGTLYAKLLGRAGGQTLIGGTGASDNLVLQSTSHATRGTIDLDDCLRILPTNVTYTAAPLFMDFNNTTTLNFASATLQVMDFRSTVILQQSADLVNPSVLFNIQPIITNDPDVAAWFGPVVGAYAHPTYRADTKALTQVQHADFWGQPTFEGVNGGTVGVLLAYGYLSNFVVNAGATITTRRAVEVQDATGAGSIGTQIGINILALTKGTTNIGLSNASTTRYTPSTAQNITAAGTAILANATIVQLTANASYTLTSAPTIDPGQSGQILTIINVDSSDTITLQDQGTLAGSNLRLSANTIALAPRDNITLVYNQTIGDWVQTGLTNVL